jgi:hypothetical protein
MKYKKEKNLRKYRTFYDVYKMIEIIIMIINNDGQRVII